MYIHFPKRRFIILRSDAFAWLSRTSVEEKACVVVVVVVVVVGRLVVSQVSELHRCSVCTRNTTTRQLVLETPQQHCPYLDQSRSHLSCCEHSWAEQTTGPRTMWLRASIHVSDPLDTVAARIRTSDREEKTCRFAFTTDSSNSNKEKHSKNGFHVAPIPSPNVRSVVPRLASCD